MTRARYYTQDARDLRRILSHARRVLEDIMRMMYARDNLDMI